MFTFIAVISQFERDLRSQRIKEGLEVARARGKFGVRKEKLDRVKKETIYKLYQEKNMRVMDICKMFSISKPTLYKVISPFQKITVDKDSIFVCISYRSLGWI